MEQEDNKNGTENPPEVSSIPLPSEKDDSKKETDPHSSEKDDSKKDTDPQSSEKDDSKKDMDPQSPEEDDSKKDTDPQLSEKDDSKKDMDPQSPEKDESAKVRDPAEGSSKPESSDKNTPRSLKAKSKIIKKSQAGKLKNKKNKGSEQICGGQRNRKNKKVVGNAESCLNADEKQISDNSLQKITNEELPKKRSQEAEQSKKREGQNMGTTDKSPIGKSHRTQKSKESIIALDKSEQKQKNKENHRESNKVSRSRTTKVKHTGMEKSQSKDKKSEKLGGIIFMCNAKTKPDCFRYRVMGVSAGKKDVVLKVKPGLKLFLYDFDLKLLYGIYKASSSGGMKLEPRAFGGNFPAQVRFNIASDCFPLPESIFKKAIKENYNEKHKFKTELTVRQVRKLTELFRPVEIHSAMQPLHSPPNPPKAIIREREAPDDVRGSWLHPHGERAAGDPYTNSNVNSYNVLSLERDHPIEWQEEISHDLFLTEKNYRAYGLAGDRRNVTTASHVNPILEPYERDYEHLHHLEPTYRSNIPAQVESYHTDPLHLNESEHRTYLHGAITDPLKDPYHAYRYGASPRAAAYFPHISRDDISSSSYFVGGRTSIQTDNLQRREAIEDGLYSIYSAADALSDYNRMQPYHGDMLDASPLPISSRYSFAGPSISRR